MATLILCFEANPSRDLDLNGEIRAIRAGLESTKYRDLFKLEPILKAQVADFIDGISKQRPSIVHFSGHGQGKLKGVQGSRHLIPTSDNEEGQLIFNDDDGHWKSLPQDALVRIFDNATWVKLIVLNGCYTHSQAEAIRNSVDCVVGTPRAIRDRFAIMFSTQFYKALGNGESVQRAHDLACALLRSSGVAKDELPTLVTRDTVEASSVYLIDPRGWKKRLIDWSTYLVKTFARTSSTYPACTTVSAFIILAILSLLMWWAFSSNRNDLTFRSLYNLACLSENATDQGAKKQMDLKLQEYLHEWVNWEGIAYEARPIGDRISSLRVKPIDEPGTPEACRIVTVFPSQDYPSSIASLGGIPSKIKFWGKISEIDRLNGITIQQARVQRAE